MRTAKVSVVVPVYNVRPHIEKCITSITNQTLEEIEIICVDDASTDGSTEYLKQIAKNDDRIKPIFLTENSTASQARKAGVLASSGTVVMFLDGDDILMPTACETAYKNITVHDVDVLHYGARVVNCANADQKRIQWNQEKMTPYQGRLHGDLVEQCFLQKKFFFTLWNKAFNGDLARKAFQHVEDGRFPRAQDLYAVFLLLYFARSYVGISEILVQYHFGTGITGSRLYNLKSFARIVQAAKVADAIARFAEKQGVERKYEGVIRKIRNDLLLDTLNQWANHLPHPDMGAGFDLLVGQWGIEELVATIAEKTITEPNKYDPKRIAEALQNSARLRFSGRRTVRVIGVFYYRYHSGGVQRVISLLIPIFLKWGYKVVLITEESRPGQEYQLPDCVEREIIPAFVRGTETNYRARAAALSKVISKHKIDVLNSHASSGVELLFDLMLAKSLGCYFVLSRHELAFASFLNSYELPVRQPAIFALADKLTCLTRMDEQYYRIMGVPSVFIPNPSPPMRMEVAKVDDARPTILWIGRLDHVQKQCYEPIEIMREVVAVVPNVRLLMVGGGWSANAAEKIVSRIKALKLTDNVELCGYTPNPEIYYSQAVCQLMTSTWESYGMVIQEGRAYGLPLVLYELPYLELLQNKRGYISVRQGDRRSAAEALISLLQNRELRETIANEAQEEFLTSDSHFRCESAWKEILELREEAFPGKTELDLDQLRMLMDNMLHLYGRGVNAAKRTENALKAELKKVMQDRQSPPIECEASACKTSENGGINGRAGRSLEDLRIRRNKYGAVGALDFLISRSSRRTL